jgi:D-threo-aldose 1-dehydrogenase
LRTLGKTGIKVTEIGFGGAPLGNLFAVVTDRDAQATLKTAWDNGCRYFDTAPLYGYGLSERRTGDALREKPRDQFVLSTKVGRLIRPGMKRDTVADFQSPMPFHGEFDYSYDATMRTFEDSLQRLGLDRIDVALIHDIGRDWHGERQPEMFRNAMNGSAKALAKLKAAGQVGAIGIGVNEADICEDALQAADFDCFLLAGRYTLLEQGAIAELLPFCESRGVGIILGGPFNSGILAGPVREGAWHDYAPAPPALLDRARRIEAVCSRHGVPLPAAALQFPLAHPAVASVIPGALAAQEVAENAAHLRRPIPPALWAELRHEGLLDPAAPTPA